MAVARPRPSVAERRRRRGVAAALRLGAVLVVAAAAAALGGGVGAPLDRRRRLLEGGGGENDVCAVDLSDAPDGCAWVAAGCGGEPEGVVDWNGVVHCSLATWPATAIVVLITAVLAAFYLLGETAEEYFCPVVRRLADRLKLSPSTAGVTLLALGNGAPDVFASLAAFVTGGEDVGSSMLGALISAGAFISAFVVGAVCVAAAPFRVEPYEFIRDVVFYLVAVIGVFAVCFTGEVHLWQAALFPLYYVLFVVVVIVGERLKGPGAAVVVEPTPLPKSPLEAARLSPASADDTRIDAALLLATQGGGSGALSPLEQRLAALELGNAREGDKTGDVSFAGAMLVGLLRWLRGLREMGASDRGRAIFTAPFDFARKATVPAVESSAWSRTYAALNIALCPVVVLAQLQDILVPLDYAVVPLGETAIELWAVVLAVSTPVACVAWSMTRYDRPPQWWGWAAPVAFVTSIGWISWAAGELLGCLSTLGGVLGVSPSILGVTVLAWGNSVGDLVADVVIARGGQPMMAVAACFSGPLFNLLIGLGLSMSIRLAATYPEPYRMPFHANHPVCFGFLFAGLIGTLSAVPLSDFRLTKPWGLCLIALYIVAMVTSLCVEAGVLRPA